jgi:hypothetical protein
MAMMEGGRMMRVFTLRLFAGATLLPAATGTAIAAASDEGWSLQGGPACEAGMGTSQTVYLKGAASSRGKTYRFGALERRLALTARP